MLSFIYSDKLAHVQVIINCRYSFAQISTQEDILAHLFTPAILDDVMSQNELTTIVMQNYTNSLHYSKQ